MTSEIASLAEGEQQRLIALHHRARASFQAVVTGYGRRPGLATAVAEARVAVLEEALAPIMTAMTARATPVACARGCAACCTMMVEVTPDEAIAMAARLDEEIAGASLAAIRMRAADKVARSAGLPPKARQALRLFCVALDARAGACMVHPVRPGPCQGYLSLDRARCEADHRGQAAPIPQPVAADYVRDAVMAAQQIVLEAAGLCQRRTELTQALLHVWREPELEMRWLAGEAVWG